MPTLTIYHLKNCSTCIRIIKSLRLPSFTKFHCIKETRITETDIDKMRELSGNYESLFSKRAIKYRTLSLKNRSLEEDEIKELILEEYTFLKRPIFLFNDDIYIGNSNKTIESLKQKHLF